MDIHNIQFNCQNGGIQQHKIKPDFCSDWYAAFVAAGSEEKVKAHLEQRLSERIQVYIPKRVLRERKNGTWKTVIRLLFPGYVLLNGQLGVQEYYECKNVPGLRKILHDGSGILPIPPEEIAVFSKLMSSGEIIASSCLLKTDDRVVVINGPLKGMEGNVIHIDKRKGRAKLKVTFFGDERIINLAVQILTKQLEHH